MLTDEWNQLHGRDKKGDGLDEAEQAQNHEAGDLVIVSAGEKLPEFFLADHRCHESNDE